MVDLLGRTSGQLEQFDGLTRVNLCHELRAWRRAGWRGRPDPIEDPVGGDFGEAGYGIELEQEAIDRAVLRRRGVPGAAIRALINPLELLLDPRDLRAARRASRRGGVA